MKLTLTKDVCEALYRGHAPAAFRRAQRMLGSVSDADEVVHDVFVRLFEQPAQFLGLSRVSTYLYSAVTNECLNRLRNQRTRARLLQERSQLVITIDPGTNAEWTVAARELLERLPEPLAAVAVYYYLDELSQREIAGILGCSHSHVAQLLAQLEHWVQQQEKVACSM